MNLKKWLLIAGGLSVVIIAVVLTAVICSRQHPSAEQNPTDEPASTDTTEVTPPQTTQPSQPSESETTAPPVTNPATEPVSTPEPRPLPPDTGMHKSANFGNVLFIGDSRTVGLRDYANLGGADVFAENGLNDVE